MSTINTSEDKLILGGHEFTSRFILGSGKFSLDLVKACIEKADAQIITLALRRANEGGLANILDYIPKNVTLLPNTSGARNAQEAVRIARLSREIGCGDFVKVEVIHDSKYLLPDNYETIKATEILAKEGFVVMPYMYPDLNADPCRVLIPLLSLSLKQSHPHIFSLFFRIPPIWKDQP